MKKVPFWISILLLIPLAACNVIGGGPRNEPSFATATLSPDQVQTQINQLLTIMPTTTAQPAAEMTATQPLPTLPAASVTPHAVTATPNAAPAEATATSAPAATTTPESSGTSPTATAAATNTPPAPTATQPPSPAFTAPASDPRNKLGNPTSTDRMDNDTTWVWPTGSDKYTTGSFENGVQTVTALTGTDGWRLANPKGTEFSSLYLEATFRTETCSGSDHYGVIVRVPVIRDSDQGYLFGFTCDGRYSLRRWNARIGTKGEMKWLVDWTKSSAISTGSNQVNRMGILTIGSRIVLYANGQLLTEVSDATFPSGYFGVFVGSDNTNNLKIQVDEMSYWENPKP